MSKHWGYYCADCEETTDTWFNHGEDRLSQYAEIHALIDGREFCWIEIGLVGDNDNLHEMNVFLCQHRGHRIKLKSEYGDFTDMEPIKKPQPKKELVIKKHVGHTFFDVTVASEDAAEWLKSEAPQFGRLLPDLFSNNKFSMEVGDEYDAGEVAAYLDTYNSH